ncbi:MULTISPECIES: ABC transporter ATP-binding protein [Microbacterium]|uniref:ABC transporter ATP-binding protein n=1 Tax=Microbacterium TaxID=33882 RepID=UPI00217CDD63|nr:MULTISPECIES: ABC transporter ATP-binding protein [Microbacterium]UWF77893.1 ABC transporter ATP-binding protein [Microbacterium neungamense]WCM56070.1 ABC transporter ATP-binding protein [Microbacterium sp. EF45047]
MSRERTGRIPGLRRLLETTGAAPGRWIATTVLVSLLLAGLDMLGVFAMLPLMQLITDGGVRGPFLEWVAGLVGSRDVATVLPVVAAMVVLTFLVKSIGALAFRWWLLGRTTRVSALAAAELMRRYVLAPYGAHRKRSASEIYRNVNDATGQASSVLLAVIGICTDVVTMAGIIVVLAWSSPLATLFAAILFGVIVFGVQRLLRRRQIGLGEFTATASLKAWQALMPGIEGFRETRLTGSAELFVNRFRAAKLEAAHAQRLMAILSDIPRYMLEIAFILAIAGIAAILALTGERDQILVVLGVFAAASVRLLPTLNRITANVATMRAGNAGLRIMVEALDQLEAEGQHNHAPAPGRLPMGDITVSDVSFRFPDSSEDVLRGVTLTIPRNRTTAFVGASGAGKSTLLDLLLGLLSPTSGEIRCGSTPIATDLAGWHAGIGVVPQEVFLSNTTLIENIAFGRRREEIDRERVEDVVRMSLLEELVGELPEGLDTVVGDRGVRLSGGQRQRVGLARALYRQPNVLVLDEATSALDNATEYEIAQTLQRLQGSMTIIVVAHRLSTVRHVDQLVFLHRGQVAATGTFDEVRAADAEFARLVELGSLD